MAVMRCDYCMVGKHRDCREGRERYGVCGCRCEASIPPPRESLGLIADGALTLRRSEEPRESEVGRRLVDHLLDRITANQKDT